MAAFREYTDPMLVAVYDTVCPIEEDPATAFYLGIAAELAPDAITDLGCGTGSLTVELARRGHRVTGVDPSPAMLDVARHRRDSDLVRWILGDATCLPHSSADLVVMTGHVAQLFLDDGQLSAAISDISRALRSGGFVVFESRDPRAEGWSAWTRELSYRRLHDAEHGEIEVWYQVADVRDELVFYDIHYRFLASGRELLSSNVLRFRPQAVLTQALFDNGFSVERVYGDWDRQPVGPTTPELIFAARRNTAPDT